MTVDTFKEMGMMLPNGKGKEIRRYFLECERELKKVKTQTHTISDKPTPHEIFDFVTMVLSITELDKNLIAASAANHVAKYYPALRPSAEELKKELVVETSERLLTPTEIGAILEQRTGIKHSGRRVNQLLAERGLQTPNPAGKDPAWLPTPKGSEFSKLLLAAQKGLKDATRQHLQWFESVVNVLA
ncbi:anti-repressor [Planktothrix phage PaV-LD]|uniref:anti-repressor n=1 Tax=Planktothrix phage PaV-LD TaxID=994601 RepID=UPI000243C933|nr:anti-repressor [Planktothrix phage PaV-LD]ADZ31607.1 anti-repressor protein [Planktothrix phage PaV-LD]